MKIKVTINSNLEQSFKVSPQGACAKWRVIKSAGFNFDVIPKC
jgi:hypothetical protein